MTVEIDTLKSLPYFADLNAADLESIRQMCFERSFQRSDMLFFEGEVAQSLFLLVSGFAKMFKTSAQGKEQIFRIAHPGEVLNEIPIFDGKPNPVSAEALSSVLIYGMKKDDLDAVIRRYPEIALNIIRALTAQTRQLIDLVEDLSFKHVIGRVSKILLEHGTNGGDGQKLTQQEMAAMAGTAREVVARSLKDLEERGLIKLDRHRIVVTDRKALEEMTTESV
jgi:CRP-like cAMP-binding protein